MLTELAIQKLPAPTKRREVPDGKISGLYLVLQPSGAKSWAVRYRFHGIPKKATLGSYPALGLGAARERAKAAIGDVAGGKDPAAEKKAKRLAAQAARGVQSDRVDRVVEQFVERHAKKHTRDWRQTERMLNKEIANRWPGQRLSLITRAQISAMLNEIAERAPIGANRVFAAFRKMCNWTVDEGIVEHNPCAGKKAPTPEKGRERTRVLSADEIRLVWQACESIGWPFGAIGKLLLSTAARREEIAGLRHAEIDLSPVVTEVVKIEGEDPRTIELSGRRLLLPGDRSKNSVVRSIPLSDLAIAIIEALPSVEGDAGFVFSTTGKTSVTGFSRAKQAIDVAVLEELKEQAEVRGDDPVKAQPLPHWTFHDLRRTVATNLQQLGTRLEVTEAVLGHVSGSRGGIVGIYQRYQYDVEKRHALDLWARRLEGIVNGAPKSNVLDFAKARA